MGRMTPHNNQATAAMRKVAMDNVPEAGRANKIAARGAITPVTIVAAERVLSHVAVSLTRSFWISGIGYARVVTIAGFTGNYERLQSGSIVVGSTCPISHPVRLPSGNIGPAGANWPSGVVWNGAARRQARR